MNHIEQSYALARERYAEFGVDTDRALELLRKTPVSAHCWQLDDLTGFENFGSVLSGGIQATGSYPGKPKSVEEYFEHLNRFIALIPGALKLALHAVYRITDEDVSRDALAPRHFAAWVDYAKEKGVGLDFNPTYFSHPIPASRFPAKTPRCAASGSTTAKPAGASANTSAGSWGRSASRTTGSATAPRMSASTSSVPACG